MTTFNYNNYEYDAQEIERFTKPHIGRDDIKDILGFKPRHIDIYQQSLVHKSVLRLIKSLPSQYEVPKYMMESNERLEFLGDSVLGMTVASFLYSKYPKEDEGFLTRTRSKLVDTKALSTFAIKLGFGERILMSRHLQGLGDRNKEKMLENAFEAWIGAIFLDMGLDYARKFILDVFEKHVEWDNVLTDTNYKDQILRFCQARGHDLPVYEVIDTSGPPHDRSFRVRILIGTTAYGEGCGKRKQVGEQAAAKQALSRILG
jgi:ribonuclease-3